ncbi:MAG TPA: chemotaxis protein CheW [Actinomycetota bacterium]|nr:chemotaxis protein CheW [Actinomycetota bacterium]
MAEATGAAGLELLLFRLAGRGYACRRETVREVVDIGTGQPPVPGMPSSSLGALGADDRPVAVVSLRIALGLPDLGPVGRIVVVETRLGPVGFLVDDVLRVERLDPGTSRIHPRSLAGGPRSLAGGYVSATVETPGGSFLLVDWDAVPLPGRPGDTPGAPR